MQEAEVFTGMQQAEVTIAPKLGIGFGKIRAGETGEVDDQAAEALKTDVEQHLVQIDPSLPSRCFDGRFCVHCLNGEPTEPRPSLAGGALITAYAAVELTGWFGKDDSATGKEKLERLNDVLRAAGINPGCHVDEVAAADAFKNPETAESRTGCGADDGLVTNLRQIYEHPERVDALTAHLVEPLLGTTDEQALPARPGYRDWASVEAATADWDPTVPLDIIGGFDGRNVEVLKADHTATHGHRELAAVAIYRENCTVDRDGLVVDTGKQVFPIDMWYIKKVAKALATGPDAVKQSNDLFHAMVAYQVGTYLALCDGSQRVITVK